MKRSPGFYLLDFIVLVVVVAVIFSIIMPKFTGAKGSNDLKICESNLHGIGMALDMYAYDHQGRFSPWDGSDPAVRHEFTPDYLVPKYLGEIPVCPSGHGYIISVNTPNGVYGTHPDFCVMIVSKSGNPNKFHPGLSGWYPLTPHLKTWERPSP